MLPRTCAGRLDVIVFTVFQKAVSLLRSLQI